MLFEILSVILIFAGLLYLFFSLGFIKKIFPFVDTYSVKNSWSILSILILGFIAFYGLVIFLILSGLSEWLILAIGIVFLAGALFVWLVSKTGYATLKVLNETTNSKDVLAKKNAELDAYIHLLSHDIKSPLRNISSYGQLLIRSAKDKINEEEKDIANSIIKNAQNLYDMLDELIFYHSLSNKGSLQNNYELIKIEDVIQMVEQHLKNTLTVKNGNVIIENELPVLKLPKAKIFVLFQNLIENGIKYNKSEKPEIRIKYQNTVDWHSILVSDNGIGIKQEFGEKIFKIFERLHGNEEYEGSGIGLANCKAIMENLSGNLKLISQPNEGSTFIVNFSKSPL